MKHYLLFLMMVITAWDTCGQNSLSQQKADRLLNDGIQLVMKQKFGPARQTFEQLLKVEGLTESTKGSAQYYQALCALNLYHDNAERLVNDFVQEHPTHPKASTAYYDLASFYYGQKNYTKAKTAFQKVAWNALSREDHNTGRFRYGYTLFNLRQLKESLDQFNFIKSLGGQYGPAASYYAGFVEYSEGDYTNALTDLQRAGENQSYLKVVPYLIANVYYKQRQYDNLLNYAKGLSEDVNNREEINLLTAEAYFKKGDYKNAVKAYEEFLPGKEEKTDKAVLLRAGYAAFMDGNDEAALRYLKNSFVDEDSIGFYSSYYLGALYLKRNQKPMALASFDISRKYERDLRLVEESSFLFAKVSYDLGKPDQAIAELEKLLVRFPQSSHTAEIKELLSQAYVNANNFNKAIAYIESLPRRGAAVDRAYQKATLLKAQDLFNREDYDGAVALFLKSLSFPVDQDLVNEADFWLAETYSLQKKYSEASSHYLKLVGQPGLKNDLLAKARFGLGYVYYSRQEYDRALFNFKDFIAKASKNDPNLADGTMRLADCYFVSKQYPEALDYYAKAITFHSIDEDYAHLQRSSILGIQGKYDQAQSGFDYLIQRFPSSAYLEEARFNKAQLDFEQGKYASAVVNYTAVISANASSKFTPYAYSRRAASYFNLKEYSKTADDYISILKKYPTHPLGNDILLPLQESLNLAGRNGEFDQYMVAFKTSNPDAKNIEAVEFESAKSTYFSQNYTGAISALGNFISAYPQSSKLTEAKYYQAESFYRNKEFDKALEVYRAIFPEKSFAFANKVVARLAEIEFKVGKHENAIPYFKLLDQSAANKKDQYTAWSGLMESFYLLAQYDSSSVYARQIIEKGSINSSAQNKASLYIGKCAMAKGDYENAKDEFLTTLNGANDQYGAEAKYLLGEIFYLSKEYKQCYETLVGLTTDFSAYPEWVGKAFLLLADSYIAQGDRYQAKATLKSLNEFPVQSIRDLAKEKLLKLDSEDATKNTVPPDSLNNPKQN